MLKIQNLHAKNTIFKVIFDQKIQFLKRSNPQSDQNPKNLQFHQKQIQFPIDCATSHPNRPAKTHLGSGTEYPKEWYRAILRECDDQIFVFEICCFEMIRHHKSFTNHFSGVRMVLIICFQNHLGFNRADFTPVPTLFSKHILPKTSDFPFWNPLFSRSPT